jgi:crotonobetainyl-CoA:carnitine CoA-transferase CaiB-like acyl-CoA transferase
MLNGFKVVELATHIAAPAAGGVLADWGADVIKIESLQGDPMRWARSGSPGGCSPVFETNNRGKRSLSLDIGKSKGREVVLRLVRNADVFLTNLRPGALERAGLDWTSLRAVNPALIYTSVSGYGLQGPQANTPAFDNAAYWSRSGMAYMTRPEGQDPFSIRQGSGDHACALATALAIVTGLLNRTQTGRGRLVETSLLRTGVFVMGADISNQIRLGTVAPTQVRKVASNPINNFFQTSDGQWIFFMPRSSAPDDWVKICNAVGAPDLIDDPSFATKEDRTINSAALVAALDRAVAVLSYDEAAAALNDAGVVWSPVQNPEQVVADPQAAAAGCFTDVEGADGRLFRAPNAPARFGDEDTSPKRPVAQFGQHTDAILSDLGFAPAEVAEMRSDNIVR